MNYSDIIPIYKTAFPQTEHEADSGYILRDGTVIDISSKRPNYCHGLEFQTEQTLAEWRIGHPELPTSNRQIADIIANDIGAIEFTIDNCRLHCIRLPNKPLTAAQRQPLAEVIGRILERGSIRVEVLKTREYAEYDANSTAGEILSKIDSYYSTGRLPA